MESKAGKRVIPIIENNCTGQQSTLLSLATVPDRVTIRTCRVDARFCERSRRSQPRSLTVDSVLVVAPDVIVDRLDQVADASESSATDECRRRLLHEKGVIGS